MASNNQYEFEDYYEQYFFDIEDSNLEVFVSYFNELGINDDNDEQMNVGNNAHDNVSYRTSREFTLQKKKLIIQPHRCSLMYNVIHIDEKWFYMSRVTQRFYLFPWEEEEPYRAIQNKAFIEKVMFIAAVARPHIGRQGDVLWVGKIGIFPFTEVVFALRSSVNRPAGTPELKATTKITRDVIRSKLIDQVLPTIRAKWPAYGVKDIWIQQDNARPHILTNDLEFMEATNIDGFNIRLVSQQASSPDMNILDLAFFRAIQSIQFQVFPTKVGRVGQSCK